MKYIVIIVLFIWQNNFCLAQTNEYQLLKKQLNYTNNAKLYRLELPTIIQLNQQEPENNTIIENYTPVPKVYNYEELAFFCKLEVQMEKSTKIPIRFRLGDVQYIEKLEGKPYSPFLIGF